MYIDPLPTSLSIDPCPSLDPKREVQVEVGSCPGKSELPYKIATSHFPPEPRANRFSHIDRYFLLSAVLLVPRGQYVRRMRKLSPAGESNWPVGEWANGLNPTQTLRLVLSAKG